MNWYNTFMKGRFSLFEGIAVLILIFVTAFIAVSLLAVIAGGFSVLRESLFSEEVRFSIKLSLLTSFLSTAVCVFLALPCAYMLTRKHFPGRKLVEVIIEVPLSLPYLVLGLCLLILFSSPPGQFLKEAGFRVVFDPKGIVMAQIMVNLPFVIKMITSAFSGVDQRLEFIAGTLGAGKWKRFQTITLGLCRREILSACILAWSRGMGEFGATLMLVGVTRMVTETLPASIYLNISTGDNDMAMASATILIVISLITLLFTGILEKKSERIRRNEK